MKFNYKMDIMVVIISSILLSGCGNTVETVSLSDMKVENEQMLEESEEQKQDPMSEESQITELEESELENINFEDLQDCESLESMYEATDADLEKLKQQVGSLQCFGHNGFDADTVSVNSDWDFWIALLFYYHEDKQCVNSLPIQCTEMKMVEGIDPRGCAAWGAYQTDNAEEIDWIATNIFNIPTEQLDVSLISDEDFVYKDNDLYYFVFDGLGVYLAENVEIIDINMLNDGRYDILFDIKNPTFSEQLQLRVKAFLKEDNGVKYWSFESIHVDNVAEVETEIFMYDEDTICRACKKYTGSPIVGIDHYDNGKPVVHCYEIVIDDEEGNGHTATSDWLTVDPETMIATDILEQYVDLKPYIN